MKGCVIPGSFDPITKGHMNLIERCSAMFETVTVAVMVNIRKPGTISHGDRVAIIRKACGKMTNVEIVLWKGLLADFMRERPGCCVIRSVRNCAEFETEITAAETNKRLYGGCETLLMPAAPEWADVSSSAVREIAAFGGDIRPLVPGNVWKDIVRKLSEAGEKK